MDEIQTENQSNPFYQNKKQIFISKQVKKPLFICIFCNISWTLCAEVHISRMNMWWDAVY